MGRTGRKKGQALDIDLGSVFEAAGHVSPHSAADQRRAQLVVASYAVDDPDPAGCLGELLAVLGLDKRVEGSGTA